MDYTNTRYGKVVGYISQHQGEPSTAIYSGLKSAGICGDTSARRSLADLEKMGVVRRETVPNPHGGPMKIVFLCGDISE